MRTDRAWLVRMVSRVLVVVTLTFLAGCADATDQPDEPVGPAEAEIRFEKADLARREAIPLVLSFTPRLGGARAEVRLEGTGSMAIKGETRFRWEQVEAGRTVTLPFTVAATAVGEGGVRAWIDVVDEAGRPLYQVAPWVDFLAGPDEVLAGHSGTLALKLEHLANLRAQGKVSLLQYYRERRRILGGGADTTIRVEERKP